MDDYFGDEEFEPKYPEENFRRSYRMSSTLFNKIVNKILSYDVEPIPEYFTYFAQRYDAIGRLSIDHIMKCTSAIRQLAYGTAPDAFDEYFQIAERTSRECLDNFKNQVVICVQKIKGFRFCARVYQVAEHQVMHGLLCNYYMLCAKCCVIGIVVNVPNDVLVSGNGLTQDCGILVSGNGLTHDCEILVSGNGLTQDCGILVSGNGLTHDFEILDRGTRSVLVVVVLHVSVLKMLKLKVARERP
ncbi:hypothetical protein Tco_0692454 [Tanacetum coccineum]